MPPSSRTLAGALLTLSGVTHVSQLFVYPAEGHVVGAAAFGVAYLLIGISLLRGSRRALWWGAILPAIGGLLGVYRYLYLQSNPFSVFHVGIDLVVVPLCVHGLVRAHRVRAAPGVGR
jgi:hypothetical protein